MSRNALLAALPPRRDADAGLAGAPLRDERRRDLGARLGPAALHEREIALVDPALAQQRMQRAQRAAPLRDQQAARGRAVEPVHELELRQLGAQRTQRLDAAERDAGAAVHGEPGRLVEHEQPLVLEHDPLARASRSEPPLAGAGAGARVGDRRHPDAIARLQPVLRVHAPRVHAHLARADQPIDMTPRHALERAEQVVVETLAGGGFVDLLLASGGLRGFFAVDSKAYELRTESTML